MPSSVQREYHQTEETPTSTALMAQTPLPPPAPPLAPLLHHGVPSPTPQTNQSPPLLIALSSALPSPSTTPMPSSVPMEYPQTEETPISTALMAQTPSPLPAPPPAPLLHHGVPSPTPQTNQSPPLLATLSSAIRRPQRHLCPHRCLWSIIQTEEKPSSTALMAQTPLPPPAPPPAPPPLLHHGVPFLNQQTNQSPPLLVAPTSASPSPSTTPMPSSVLDGVSSNRGDAFLYRLDGSDAFTSNCATTGTLTSPWCTLSQSTDQPITSLAGNSFFGTSVALNDTYALIGAERASSNRGEAFLYRLDGTNAFNSSCEIVGQCHHPLVRYCC